MRVFGQLAIVCLGAGVALGAQAAQAPDPAAKVLADAREALGGEKKLSAVKNFVATGRTRQVRGDNLVPIEFEIAVELPDKYVRKDEVPAQESEPTSSGFNGDGLIQIPPPAAPQMPMTGGRPGGPPAAAPAGGAPPPPPPGAGAGMPPGAAPGMPPGAGPGMASGGRPGGPPAAPPDPRKARVATIKQDFVKLTLGMFATSFPSYPLAFTFAGQAEAPQGKADMIDVKAAPNFALRLFVNTQTHLPIMVSWQVPVANVTLHVTGTPAPANLAPGAVVVDVPPAPDASAPQADKDKYGKDVQDIRRKAIAAAKPIEYRIYYADYRDVGGMQFPFRLRRAIAGETVEETNFDGFKINTKIDPRRFEVVK